MPKEPLDLPASAEYVPEDHITIPRPAWWEGEQGYRKRILRVVKRLVIGDALFYLNGRFKVEYRSDREGDYFQVKHNGLVTCFYIEQGHIQEVREKLADFILEHCRNKTGEPDFLDNFYLGFTESDKRATKKGAAWIGKEKTVGAAETPELPLLRKADDDK